MRNHKKLPCQHLYLNEDGADVWFVSDGERIPGHKLFLTTVSPYFKAMFCGALPEQGDVDMNDNASAAEIKEFLQFFYMQDVKLSEKNIQGVMNLAKQSMVDEFLTECEHFLIDKLTIDTMCWGYQMAVFYEAKQLQLFCEREICLNTIKILKSDSFLNVNYETVHRIVQLDTLFCNEKDIFDACISWASAACTQNQQNPNNSQNLRTYLKDLLYEIRFVSMDDETFGTILYKYSELFSKDETQEIVFIRSGIEGFTPKLFNPRKRLFKKYSDENEWLICQRFISYETGIIDAAFRIERLESVKFSSNRPILLRGFLYSSRFNDMRVRIIENREDDYILPIFEISRQIEYEHVETIDVGMLKAKFDMPVIIEPNIKYEIQLEIPQPSGSKRSMLKPEVCLGHGITIQFYSSEHEHNIDHHHHSAIQTLFFSTLDNWPIKLFSRRHQSTAQNIRESLKTVGRKFLKCISIIVFITSLIM